jgi:hypothetical protein
MSSANSIFNIERHFRDKEGVKYNLMAFGFTFIGYLMGVMWLFSNHFILNILGVLLTAEALIISAYLLHEFSHYSIFKTPQMNALWGNIMSWMNGSCYGTFEEIRNKHMRHHIDRADVVSFDMRRFIENLPTFFKAIVKALEWLYIPVAEKYENILAKTVLGLKWICQNLNFDLELELELELPTSTIPNDTKVSAAGLSGACVCDAH